MSKLSASQIYAVARKAGFSPPAAVTATAIALAESGGNPNAYNGKPPDNSYGLWQINMIGAMGPARRAQFGLSSNDELFNPETNARAAYAISHGGSNFGPWSTYTDGAYRSNMQAGLQAAADEGAGGSSWITNVLKDIPIFPLPGIPIPGSVNTGDLGHIPNPLSWTSAIGKLGSNLLDSRFWLRIGQGLAAAMLLLIGAGLVFRRDAISAAKGAMLA